MARPVARIVRDLPAVGFWTCFVAVMMYSTESWNTRTSGLVNHYSMVQRGVREFNEQLLRGRERKRALRKGTVGAISRNDMTVWRCNVCGPEFAGRLGIIGHQYTHSKPSAKRQRAKYEAERAELVNAGMLHDSGTHSAGATSKSFSPKGIKVAFPVHPELEVTPGEGHTDKVPNVDENSSSK